jgi:hypothetical protein
MWLVRGALMMVMCVHDVRHWLVAHLLMLAGISIHMAGWGCMFIQDSSGCLPACTASSRSLSSCFSSAVTASVELPACQKASIQ